MCAYVGAHICSCAGQRLMLGVLLNHAPSYVLRQSLPLNLELTSSSRPVVQGVPESLLSLSPVMRIQACATITSMSTQSQSSYTYSKYYQLGHPSCPEISEPWMPTWSYQMPSQCMRMACLYWLHTVCYRITCLCNCIFDSAEYLHLCNWLTYHFLRTVKNF